MRGQGVLAECEGAVERKRLAMHNIILQDFFCIYLQYYK